MARSGPEPNVTLSILDRLIDLAPGQAADPPARRAESLRQLKISLRRDLEWLLNTRRIPEAIEESSSELENSLYNYGLPDTTALGIHSIQDQNRLLRMIEVALATFEPRIQGARVSLEQSAAGTRVMKFQIQGLLRIDPAPERVTFDTVLELIKGDYQVKTD
ncbi:MAG: type VI secretion system baseplate subunit TssE [Bryobacteraceae bacterium]